MLPEHSLFVQEGPFLLKRIRNESYYLFIKEQPREQCTIPPTEEYIQTSPAPVLVEHEPLDLQIAPRISLSAHVIPIPLSFPIRVE
jgi:hypothetical protein